MTNLSDDIDPDEYYTRIEIANLLDIDPDVIIFFRQKGLISHKARGNELVYNLQQVQNVLGDYPIIDEC